MSNVLKITEMTMEYPTISLKLCNDSEEIYDFAILFLYCCEVHKGFGVKKIYKTNKAGTKVCYRAFENNEEAQKYVKMVKNKIKEFNQKWHGDYIR